MNRYRLLQRNTLYGILIGIFLLSAAAVYAADGSGSEKKEFRKEWKEKRAKMYEELGLSEEQKEALKAHKEAHRSEMKSLREQLREKRTAFREILQDPSVDDSAVIAANNEIKVLSNALSDHRVKGILEVRKILTPEQFAKFSEMHKQHHKKHFDKFKDNDGE